MKLALLLCFSLQLFSLNAQGWFENQPAWANYYSQGFSGDGFEYMTVGPDTLLDGKPAVVLERFFDMNSVNDFSFPRIARQHGDTIWVLGRDTVFHVMYNFSLGVGDSVHVTSDYDNSKFQYVIDSTGQMGIGGQSLRFQQVKIKTGYDYLTCEALIIEKIGMINGQCFNSNTGYLSQDRHHFFLDEPNTGATDGPEWEFCRFQNDQFEFSSASSFCAALTDVAEKDQSAFTFTISPNPFHDYFTLVALPAREITTLRLFDTAGRNLHIHLTPGSNQVDAQRLLPGVYFLEITTRNRERQFIRLVKY